MPEKNATIHQIEQGLGYSLSDEQVAILKSNFQQPTLVNACAGAGKTTTMITSIFYQALEGHTTTNQVLGITFSKKAQEDMERKFAQIQHKIATAVPQVNQYKMPQFKTFHALFYHLLQQIYPNYRFNVIEWSKYTHLLIKDIQYPREALTDYENVKRIMNQAAMLINMGYSYDGITIRQNEHNVKIIVDNLISPTEKRDNYHQLKCMLHYYGILEPTDIDDYIRVIQHYKDIKKDHSEIDFNDMQYMLENALTNLQQKTNSQRIVNLELQSIKQLYIDEFQDINPVQWELIMLLFDADIINHIVVIGDDDQSIYRFRGSNPTFILNFAKRFDHTDRYHNAQTFNLSTNYRTKENILKLVKPMIESNTLRLNKSLKAHNPGGTVEHKVRDQAHDQAVIQFVKDARAHPDYKMAILARENTDLSLLSDYLAEQGLYPKFGENNQRYIFQNINVYQNFVTLMHAIYYDDFTEYRQNANQIGFSSFRNFLNQYSQYAKISEFLKDSNWQNDLQSQISGYSKNSWQAKQNYQRLYELKENFQLIAENKNEPATQKYLTTTIFDMIINMTSDYYDYMLKNHYLGISKSQLQNVKSHLKDLTRHAESCGAFFLKESQKKAAMISTDSKIEIMTFHRSKGLEFDETLIYNSNQDEISPETYLLSQVFPAKQTPDDLVETIIKKPAKTLALMNANRLASLALFNQTMNPNEEMQISFANLMRTIQNSDYLYQPVIKFNQQKFRQDRKLINLMYLEVNNLVKYVEEEKRLLYVAVTRAKNKVIFDQPINPGIITSQLNFSKEKSNLNN